MGNNTIRLTESQLKQYIRESVSNILNEIAGYNRTMQNSVYNPNTVTGKLMRTLRPSKAQQYDRIQQHGNEIGAQATQEYNAINAQQPRRSYGGFGPFDVTDYDFSEIGDGNYERGEQVYGQMTQPQTKRMSKYGHGGKDVLRTRYPENGSCPEDEIEQHIEDYNNGIKRNY